MAPLATPASTSASTNNASPGTGGITPPGPLRPDTMSSSSSSSTSRSVLQSDSSAGGGVTMEDVLVQTTDSLPAVKCVLVGDGAVGKTSLLVSYASSECPSSYVPTAFDNYAVVVRVDDKPIRLQLCDTAGQLELDSLRALCYTDADVFVVCFSVVRRSSFDAVSRRWLPEVRRRCPSTPVILVGTQSDLRQTSSRLHPVSLDEATSLAERVGAAAYVECSASERYGVKDVFDAAIVVSLHRRGLVGGSGRRSLLRRRRGGGTVGRSTSLLGGLCRRRRTSAVKSKLDSLPSTASDDLVLLEGSGAGAKSGAVVGGGKRRSWMQLMCCCCCCCEE